MRDRKPPNSPSKRSGTSSAIASINALIAIAPMTRRRTDDWIGRKPSIAVSVTRIAPYVLTDMTVTRAIEEISITAIPKPGVIMLPTVETLVTVAPSLISIAKRAPRGTSQMVDKTAPAYVHSTTGFRFVPAGRY